MRKKIKENYNLNSLYEQLKKIGTVYLTGGALREYCFTNSFDNIRDMDFAIYVKNPFLYEALKEHSLAKHALVDLH